MAIKKETLLLLGGVGLAYLFLSKKSGGSSASSGGVRERITKIIGVIESKLNYASLNNQDPSKEFSYGFLQANIYSGSLYNLLQIYIQMGGKYASKLQGFGDLTESSRLAHNSDFAQTLVAAANDDPIMRQAQDAFFTQEFINPAIYFAQGIGLQLPASWLVAADTFINSGTTNGPSHLRNHIPSTGTEQERVLAYLQWRKGFVRDIYTRDYGADSIHVDYNMWRQDFLSDVVRNNPQLSQPVTIHYKEWSSGVTV